MKLNKYCRLSLALALSLGTSTTASFAQQNVQPATIVVDASKSLGPVNPLAFGDNIEAADATHIYAVDPIPDLHNGEGIWDDVNRVPVPFVVTTMRSLHLGALRYPGGTLANNYDWHKAVGPLATRGDWHFGIDEYIASCRAFGCEPQFIVADYVGTPKDAAGLVEYLNSPATPKHPWAMLRAKCGHVQPYHVRLFELGNETDNGGGYPWRIMSPDQYAGYANGTIKAMRAVDPSIKIGIISATGKDVLDPWNPIVLRKAGANADFLVVHHYAVGYDSFSPVDRLMRGCMASPDQYQQLFAQYHALVRKTIGHDLPIALTEYNGAFAEDSPPLRFSYGAALFSADLIRVALQPSNGVMLANYWQAVNGYWGFLRGQGDQWTTLPAYETRELWGHFGKELLQTNVAGPTIAFEGVGGTDLAQGPKLIPSMPISNNLLTPQILADQATGNGYKIDSPGMLTYTVSNITESQYPGFVTLPTPPQAQGIGCIYTLSADVRTVPDPNTADAHVSLGLGDSRGWAATQSAILTSGGPADGQWRHLGGVYKGMLDAKAVDALVRIENPTGPFSGRVEVKNIVLSAATRMRFPAYSAITTAASLSADHKMLSLIVFNKSTTDDIAATIQLCNFTAGSAKRWTVTGPDLACTTTGPGNVDMIDVGVATPLASAHSIAHLFPARSMTAFEISSKKGQ